MSVCVRASLMNDSVVQEEKEAVNESKKMSEGSSSQPAVELPAKQPYKNFTINPSSKYINRLKQLYNKDYGSSNESISNRGLNPNITNDDSKQGSKYIKKLLNTYEVPFDSIENFKITNELNEQSSNNNKINKLKEKFASKHESSDSQLLDQKPSQTLIDSQDNSRKVATARQKFQKAKTIDLSDFISWTPNDLPIADTNKKIIKSASPDESDTKSSLDSMKVHSDSHLLTPVAPKKSILKIPSTVIEKSLVNLNDNVKPEIIRKEVEETFVTAASHATNENKNNRNRFKKKVTVRSHSAEIVDLKNYVDENDEDLTSINDRFPVEGTNLRMHPNETTKTKSYGENLHYLHKMQEIDERQPAIFVKSSSMSSLSSITRSSASDSSSSSSSSSTSSLSTSSTALSMIESNCEKCQSSERDKKESKKKSSKKDDSCKKCEKRRRNKHHKHHHHHHHHHKKRHHHHHHGKHHHHHHHHHHKKDTFNNMIDSKKFSLNDFNEFYTIKNKPKYYSSDDSICGIPKTIPK